MKNLSASDLRQINGGFNQEAYDAGKEIGETIKSWMAEWGILKLLL